MREGADMLMVKPGMPYLDVVRDVKARVSSWLAGRALGRGWGFCVPGRALEHRGGVRGCCPRR